MSEFSVYRTLLTHPGLMYCLVLDGDRIAGDKPDYRGNNYVTSWVTKETYGPVDELRAENANLRKVAHLASELISHDRCEGCVTKRACDNGDVDECWMVSEMRELLDEIGVE